MFLIMKASQQDQGVELMGQILGECKVPRPGWDVALVHAGRGWPQNMCLRCLAPGWPLQMCWQPSSVLHVLLAEDIQIPELYGILSSR